MATDLYSTPTSVLLNSTATGQTIATLQLGGGVANVPVLAIKQLTNSVRKHVTCSLDGTIDMIVAPGGVSTCVICCLEVLKTCDSKTPVTSAMQKYKELKKHGTQDKIAVTLGSEKSKSTFNGYVDSCSADAYISENGTPAIIVNITATGEWT